MSQYVPVCLSLSQYVSVCPSTSQYVSVCPSMSQSVPVCLTRLCWCTGGLLAGWVQGAGCPRRGGAGERQDARLPAQRRSSTAGKPSSVRYLGVRYLGMRGLATTGDQPLYERMPTSIYM
jgi:hypothetical protein